ncbi:MAG: MOFRL family protein, partial [Patescibacteria group bacterium]
QTASNIAKKMNLSVRTLKHPITGEARKVAKKLILQSTKGTLLIASGETTVTCRGNGQGGRNQELVLSALQYLKPNQIVLAMGTDGVDGICPQKIAGAIADKETLQKAKKQHLSIKKFLDNNDSYHFFKKTGGHIKTGPTGTNLGDLVLLLTT